MLNFLVLSSSCLRNFAFVQSSVDDVDRLLKQHENFEKTLMAQEERRRTLSDLAVGMARAGHFQKEWYACQAWVSLAN